MVTLPKSLAEWLAHCERLHPRTIDLTLERVQVMLRRLALRIDAPVVTVGGTNGKGSSCAMLEAIALQAGYRVALHTSPHLVHFEERCRIDGAAAQAEALLPHFEAVERARGDLPLTFFEFTLLAIVRHFVAEAPDLVILEVGLGGRFDAVNAFDADCALITSIALDHMAYLGTTREAIGFEKAGIMRPGRPAIVSDPLPPQSMIDHARAIGADLWISGRDFRFEGDRQQWNWFGRGRSYTGLAHPVLRGANQLLNAAGVLAAFEALRDRLPVTAQAIRVGLARVDLPARFQIVPGQPTLVLDVAHNPHAVAALAHNLDQMGFFPRTHAIFGAMQDKDVAQMLCRMAPLIDSWHFTDLPTPRATDAQALRTLHAELVDAGECKGPAGVAVECHASPALALRGTLAAADPADRIIVFGSFFTVGGVIEELQAARSARRPA
ncbi:MAG TPA: bifunctional tetrahydrofolate synthase/dihydrofolate synthase [Burkholderiaceae bacterium]|nr:bifunctional tetrahydrofolate synthase/dihydrofolate synthase [Burkholderiaceae bacterium]